MANEKPVKERTGGAPSGERHGDGMPMSLIMKLYRSGDRRLMQIASEQVVYSYGNYVWDIIHSRYASFMEQYADDLFHYGVIGLLEALKGYDGKHAFTTYSKVFIIHELSAFVCSLQGNSSIYYAQNQRQVKSAAAELERQGQKVTAERITELTGLSLDVAARELSALTCADMVYLDELESPDALRAAEQPQSVESIIEDKLMWEKLESEIRQLTDEEKTILKRHIWRKESRGNMGMSRYLERKKREEIYDRLKRALK